MNPTAAPQARPQIDAAARPLPPAMRPARRTAKRNKAPARWGVVAATALSFGTLWHAVSPDPIVAVTASAVEAAAPLATEPAVVAAAQPATAAITATATSPSTAAIDTTAPAPTLAVATEAPAAASNTTTITSTARLRTRGS